MIQLKNLALAFNSQVIFDNISWHIKRQERIGLVGPNGAGKTTLMRIIIDQMAPDSGQIQIAKNVSFGYLPQQQSETKGKPLLDEVLSGVAEVKAIESEILQLQNFLSQQHDQREYEKKMKRLGDLQHRFEELGGFHLEYEAKKILSGLGFSEDQFDHPCESFSGGWQMRIALAKLLLRHPSVLLLDEPTNHLDIKTMEWLESFLYKYAGAIVIVSHDRFFLDRIVTKIAAIDRGQLTEYSGSYSFFETERQRQEDQLLMQYERQKEEIKRVQRFIERFRYKASKASQVQSRIKQLEKMEKIIPPSARKKAHFQFPAAVRSGRIVFQLDDVAKSYNGKTVFENANFTIERGERVALVGVNGAGKSTLSRILTGLEAPSSGQIERGHQVKYSFYAQETANALKGEQSILDELLAVAPLMEVGRLRTLLGCFLFQGDAVFKPVNVLSGGEKSRLALAKIMLQESNVLILDEPTNHLDIAGKDVLQDALNQYQGTLILVSHDRYFLDKLVSRIIELSDAQIREYLGNYSYYLQKREQLILHETSQEENTPAKQANGSKKSKNQKRREAEERKAQNKITREKNKKIHVIESEIELKESRKAAVETQLADVGIYSDQELSRSLTIEYRELIAELSILYEKWDKVTEN